MTTNGYESVVCKHYQLPITNSQFPIPNSQLPITYYQLPITYYLSSPGVRAYVRDRHLLISEFNQPDKLPYNLRPDEKGKNHEELFDLAVGRAIPGKDLTPDYFASQDWKCDRETLKIDGQHLYNLNIWEVLLKEISNEAYNLCFAVRMFMSAAKPIQICKDGCKER